MQTNTLLLLALVAVAGCGNSNSPANNNTNKNSKDTPTPTSTTPQPNPSSSKEPGLTADPKPTIYTLNIPSGITNMDDRGTFFFEAVPVPQTVLETVEQQSKFIDNNGSVTNTVALFEPAKQDNQLPKIKIQSDAVLSSDSWYWFSLSSSEALSVKSKSGPLSPEQLPYTIKFFTGSAPRVLNALFASKVSNVLHIRFSEPMKISTIINTIKITSGGNEVSSCLLVAGECAKPENANGFTEIAQIALKPAAIGTLILRVAPSAQGSGRTVGEGAVFLDEKKTTDGGLEYELKDWVSTTDGQLWVASQSPAP